MIREPDRRWPALRAGSARGVRLAVDDLGARYIVAVIPAPLPVDEVKSTSSPWRAWHDEGEPRDRRRRSGWPATSD